MNIRFWRTVSGLVLLIHLAYIIFNYSSLPSTIPTHFNGMGEADAWGSKNSIWFLFFINLLCYVLFSILSIWLGKGSLKDKWGLNLPEKLKEDSTGEIQVLVQVMMETFNIYTTFLLFLSTLSTVLTAHNQNAQFLIIIILFMGIFPPLIILGVFMSKASAIQKRA